MFSVFMRIIRVQGSIHIFGSNIARYLVKSNFTPNRKPTEILNFQ